MARIQFFRDNQRIDTKGLFLPGYGYTDFIQLLGVSGSQAGAYTCDYWKTESGREIPSEMSRPTSVAVTDPDPAPQLTVSPQQPVYITGEAVILTCSAAGTSIVSGVRFFRADQEIQPKELPSPRYNYTNSIQLSGVSRSQAGAYTCESWKTESEREITSKRSQSISIAMTDRDPAPELTVSPKHPVYITGEAVTLTCSAAGTSIVSRVRFFRDDQEIHSKELPSPRYRYTDSIQLSGVSRAQARAYTCETWKTESGREIASKRSRPISIALTDSVPAPQITVFPKHPVYITGEAVTLTCSAAGTSTVSGVRFFMDGQKIHSKELPSPHRYTDSIQLSGVSRSQAGAYTCETWKRDSGREITSKRSRPISIALTDRDPAPELTVSPKHPVYITGEAVTLTCSAAGTSIVSRVRFFRDDQEIHSKELPSPRYRYTDSIQLSGVSRAQARAYTCETWKTESGREIASKRSRPISIALTGLPEVPARCDPSSLSKADPVFHTPLQPHPSP
ncbi:acyl-CoA dehydrogenase [Platysternon megacephalum]|uniref:Acyl-CoA dehydrogenase n=1 Tax=Platysternon megacephalum TaxID=55544 RepID=A0A4D9DHC0_9SAUR|nr:acyl-CoA dehydrogenase [Platysternon megacephalum]